MRKIIFAVAYTIGISGYAFSQTPPILKPQLSVKPKALPTKTHVNRAFVKIEGIDGEVAEANHRKWIEIISYSFALERANVTSGRAGRAAFSEFTLSKRVDRSSPSLAIQTATGRHIPKVEIEIQEGPLFYRIELENVVINGVETQGHKSEWPVETIKLGYSKIKWQYESGAGSNYERAWDVIRNRMD